MNWLLQFDTPTDEWMERIRQLISHLPIVRHSDWRDPSHPRKRAFSGGLADITEALRRAIERDAAQYTAEAGEAPYRFDYVVMPGPRQKGSLFIATRLYSDVGVGNVFYGRLVKRVGEDAYLLWIDD